MNFPYAKEYIIARLKKELSASMVYHTLEHTLDVHKVARELIKKEKVNSHDGQIIQTAALYHDAGMLIRYKDHELASIDIARKSLPDFSYSQDEIDEICDLIKITRLPQRPETYTGQLLCDADMDNLGREDFFIQSFRLKQELELNGFGKMTLKQWLANLIQFLVEHKYYSASSIALRQATKMKNLEEIREIVKLF